MLKNLDTYHKHKLLDLHNFIWSSNTFSTDWSKSLLVPILKPGKDPQLAMNYRPIRLSTTFSKTMQRMVVERLSWIIEEKGFLTNDQFGFRKQRSTNDSLLVFENAIINSFAQKQHRIPVFFDIEKAYDRKWSDLILQTLCD